MHRINCLLLTLTERYILLYSFFFKLIKTSKNENALWAIPETCVDRLMSPHQSSLFAGHQVIIKTYLTTGDKIFIPGLIHHQKSYIKECQICQLSRNEKNFLYDSYNIDLFLIIDHIQG